MNDFFAGIIQEDPSNLYFCICFRGLSNPYNDITEEVYWSYSFGEEINVAIETGGNEEPLVMIGVRLNRAIIIRRQPNFFHTRWNISHTEPDFDNIPRNNLVKSNFGCGKADLLQKMWIDDLSFQMRFEYF